MHTYISIIRGINVSGQKLMKMSALKLLYENLGYTNVITYLQSGNIIFTEESEDESRVAEKVRQAIKIEYGFDVPVMIFSITYWQQLIRQNPFVTKEQLNPAFFHVTILEHQIKPDKIVIGEDKLMLGEEVEVMKEAIYLYCPNGYGKTKLTNNFLEKLTHTTATTRNWKTVNELFHLAKKIV